MKENEIARSIVDAAYRVHVALGPGLLESVYLLALAWEFEQRGLNVVRSAKSQCFIRAFAWKPGSAPTSS
jgi:GxxExxY protein